jgi:hypothetical protein
MPLKSVPEPDVTRMIPELVDWVVAAWHDGEPDAEPELVGPQAHLYLTLE